MNDRFKQQIESAMGRAIGFNKRGMPLNLKCSMKTT